ncbi:MAG: hypothetical protein OEY59_13225 [Deltaproteobacteria bacterium]|nr:hypothetical protein [Deltaproteobacteria bacterium]
MEIFLDIDGVILDFESSFIAHIRNNHIPELPKDYLPKSWEMDEEFSQIRIKEVWDEFVSIDSFSELKLLVDQTSFNQLSSQYALHLITNIPKSLFSKRVKNLKSHALNFTSLEIGGHFNFGDEDYPVKSVVINKIRDHRKKIVFLDDHPTNCYDVKSRFPDSIVFLMSRPHNQNQKDHHWIRVANWMDFLEKLKEIS